MSSNESRRDFLKGAVAGAGVVATATVASPAAAQNAPMQMDHGAGLGAFFNLEESATISAFTERLMPGAPGKPGARDAGVLNYIDLALAGAYGDLQEFYRRGLAQLDQYCRKTHREPFVRLSAGQQDAVITALEEDKATGFT